MDNKNGYDQPYPPQPYPPHADGDADGSRGFYPQQHQGYAPPGHPGGYQNQYNYGPPQGPPPQPQVIYVQNQPDKRDDDDGCCCGCCKCLLGCLACCAITDCLC